MKKIKFIYFDVGGVALLDFSKTNKWNEMLDDLGISEQIKAQFTELFHTHEQRICVGEDIKIFTNQASEQLGIKFPENYDMTADFVNRFEKNASMLELFSKHKNDFRLGLLTGQYPNMLNMIFNKGLMPSNIWDVIIDSSVEKINKPNPEIYSLAEKKANVEPESILFVDNKAQLLENPKQKNWQTFEYDPSEAEYSSKMLENYIYGLKTFGC